MKRYKDQRSDWALSGGYSLLQTGLLSAWIRFGSVLAQTYPGTELIVVDDGSPDNVAELVEALSRCRRVRQENRGLAGRATRASVPAPGAYVVFLDADDRLIPNAVESHLSCFAKHTEAGFVVGDIDQISLDGSHAASPRWPVLEANHYEEMLRVNHVANTIAVMFRRSVIEQLGGFNASCSPAEDSNFLVTCRAAISERGIITRLSPNTGAIPQTSPAKVQQCCEQCIT